MSGYIEVVLRYGESSFHSFRLDRLTCADLAVAEVHRQAAVAVCGRSIRFIGYEKRRSPAGDLWRLTEHTWHDALRLVVPVGPDAAGRFDRLDLRVLDSKFGFESAAVKEAAPVGSWEVQTDAGWQPFEPGRRFKGEAGEEIVFWMSERKYRVSFATAFEGIQVNLSTLRSRPIRKVVGASAEDFADDGPEDGTYKIVLKGGDNPRSTFEQLSWELCAHRAQATDKRSDCSTYAMLHKAPDGKTAAGRSCNLFELTRVGAYYKIVLKGGEGTNTYAQVGWQLFAPQALSSDMRNADSMYASIAEPAERCAGSLFALRRFGSAYKIVLKDREGERSGWELCAHRALARDQRSKTTTFATFHRPAEGRTCNHFQLQRVGGPRLPSSEAGVRSHGLDLGLGGLAALGSRSQRRAMGGASRALGSRAAKTNMQGSERSWSMPETAAPCHTTPSLASVVVAPLRSVPGNEDSTSDTSWAQSGRFNVICQDELCRFFDVDSQQDKMVDEAMASFQVLDVPAVEICDAFLDVDGCEALTVSAALPASAADEDEWSFL